MPISLEQPIVIPAVTLDKVWFTDILIKSEVNGEAVARVECTPFNLEGQFRKDRAEMLHFRDIMAKCAQNPNGNMAKAMYFLIEAIEEERQAQIQAQQQPQEEENEA